MQATAPSPPQLPSPLRHESIRALELTTRPKTRTTTRIDVDPDGGKRRRMRTTTMKRRSKKRRRKRRRLRA
jgi:hypothetical protein